MVQVGLIGLGTCWESRYRCALEALENRIRVAAVFDPVAERARQVAAQREVAPVEGVLALARRHDVRALMLLDAELHRRSLLSALCEVGKPIFIAGGLQDDAALLGRLYAQALTEGRTLMPELTLRYLPAVRRLQELIATRIGAPRAIRVEARTPGDQAETPAGVIPSEESLLIDLFDWCRHIFRADPVSVSARPGKAPREQVVDVAYRLSGYGGPAPEAQLHLMPQTDAGDNPENPDVHPPCRFDVTCAEGSATIESPQAITWQSRSGPVTESLAGERCATEMMLDLFCRRVVGGLIPVPDFGDVCRALELVRGVEQSRLQRRAIRLNVD